MFSGFKKTFKRSTPTTQQTRVTRTTLPAAPTRPEIETPAPTVPSYKHADAQKGAIDTEAEEKGKEDEKIEAAEGRAAATNDATTSFSRPSNKGKGNERHQDKHTDQQGSQEEDALRKFWHLELGFDLEPVYNGDYNEYTPNALALFEMLEVSGTLIRRNRILNKNHAEYLDYSVACYYAFLFFIQILRARKAAGKLSGEDSSFLRRFDRAYPEESLPIAEQIYPIFSSIVSVQMEDSKYEWVVPRIASEIFIGRSMNDIEPTEGSVYLQPLVPHMLGILRFAISNFHNRPNESYDDVLTGTTDLKFFDDEGRFVPTRLSATAINLFGIANFRTGANPTAGANHLCILSACGVSYPFLEGADELTLAQKHWMRSKFRSLNVSAIAVTAGQGEITLDNDKDISKLERFLCMTKEDEMEWFGELVNQAAVHARFSKKVYNLSEVPTTGGNEVLIPARFKRFNPTNSRRTQDYADTMLGITNATIAYYPRPFERLTAAFGSTRADLKRSEILQSLSFGVNATLPIIQGGSTLVGGTHQLMRVVPPTGTSQRTGAYWTNNELTYILYDYDEATPANATQVAKPMFRGWSSMYQEEMHVVRPAGY